MGGLAYFFCILVASKHFKKDYYYIPPKFGPFPRIWVVRNSSSFQKYLDTTSVGGAVVEKDPKHIRNKSSIPNACDFLGAVILQMVSLKN